MCVYLYSCTEQPIAFDIAHHMRTWSSMSFYLAVVINFMVAFCYPFDKRSEYVGKLMYLLCF